MAKHVKRSVLPIYLIGVTWLVYALTAGFAGVPDYLRCAIISAVVFAAAKAIFPDKVYTLGEEKAPTNEPEKEPKKQAKPAGNPQVEALLKERDRAVSEMRRLNDAIEDEKISAQIDHLEGITDKIIDHVANHPEKLPQIRRFLDYYLPTTLKILNAYDRMDATGISGSNIDTTKEKVAGMMDGICTAFEKQLDSLFGAEALDISTDITVMENLLNREGFGGHAAGGADEIKLEL